MIKSLLEIEKIRIAASLVVEVLDMITPYVTPGRSTEELDAICHQYMVQHGAIPAPLELGFPKAVCISVNEEVCHGIPSHRILTEKDIVNIDVSLNKDGYYGDSSKMFCMPNSSDKAKRLSKITQECLYLSIASVRSGVNIGQIGWTIMNHAQKHHFSVVRDYCGHGVGSSLHEYPQVLHVAHHPKEGIRLRENMIFTIEPMINIGNHAVRTLEDRWTVVTEDGSYSAQWEHMVLVTKDGCEVLTRRKDETIPLTFTYPYML